jgi:hypothetical protein
VPKRIKHSVDILLYEEKTNQHIDGTNIMDAMMNMEGRLTLNIPEIWGHLSLAKLEIFQLTENYGILAYEGHHDISKRFRIPKSLMGCDLKAVWKNIKTNEVLHSQAFSTTDISLEYYIAFPDKLEQELPF